MSYRHEIKGTLGQFEDILRRLRMLERWRRQVTSQLQLLDSEDGNTILSGSGPPS